jgi:hypothetical protein
MRLPIAALAAVLAVGFASGQEDSGYATAENPFQGDFPLVVGQPLVLRVDVLGVHLDGVTVSALGEARAGQRSRCEVTVAGTNTGDKKPLVTAVLLLEDADDKPLERLTLDPFKVKPGKPFQEKQRLAVAGDALLAARKAYLFIQLAF